MIKVFQHLFISKQLFKLSGSTSDQGFGHSFNNFGQEARLRHETFTATA